MVFHAKKVNLKEAYIADLNEEFEKCYPNFQFEVQKTYNILDDINLKMNVDMWKNQFNYKIFDISTNYIQARLHLIEEDNGIEYSVEEMNDLSAWYAYYSESLSARIITAFDLLVHIINVSYKINIEPKSNFNREVMKELKHLDMTLHGVFKETINSDSYGELNKLRNSFSHNYSPVDNFYGLEKTQDEPESYDIVQNNRMSDKDVQCVIECGLLELNKLKHIVENHIVECGGDKYMLLSEYKKIDKKAP